jgi:zinc finger HIT domain-containing protein 1
MYVYLRTSRLFTEICADIPPRNQTPLDTAFVSMLVQEIPKAAASQPKKPARGSVYYGRAALDSAAQQTRITRHLLELEQDNYHAVQIDIPKPERTSPPPYNSREISSWKLIFGWVAPRKQHKTTSNVRKLLATRKTLTNLLDEAGLAGEVYHGASVKTGLYPSRTFCSVCGYWGKYGCMKCGDRYCGEACGETHRGTLTPR